MHANRSFRFRWLPFVGAIVILSTAVLGLTPRERVAIEPTPGSDVGLYSEANAFLKRGNPELKEVALTFDDGPHPESLSLILEHLHTYGIKATFFLVGKRVSEHPQWAMRIDEAGHEVGNHTYDHERLTRLDLSAALEQIDRCNTALVAATGKQATLFRPPGMRHSPALLQGLKDRGYTTVGWTDAAKDFETESYKIAELTPDDIAERVMSRVKNGGIILLHDTEQTAKALPRVISFLRVSGFKFVTVSEMLSRLPKPVLVKTPLHRAITR